MRQMLNIKPDLKIKRLHKGLNIVFTLCNFVIEKVVLVSIVA